jgi:hypothetical protein
MKDNTLQISLQQHLPLNIPRQRIDKWISSQTTGALALSFPIKISREILVSTSWSYHGLFWMQRRARLKAMLRHNSSVEVISLCRSFWGQRRKLKPVYLSCTEWCSRVCVGGLFVYNKGVLLEGKLTVKYWMISGFLLDLSSTSVRTSSTSETQRGAKCW